MKPSGRQPPAMPEVMNTLRDSNAGLPASVYNYNEICDRKIPIPALHRGWLHSRELRRQWNVEGIAAKIDEMLVQLLSPRRK